MKPTIVLGALVLAACTVPGSLSTPNPSPSLSLPAVSSPSLAPSGAASLSPTAASNPMLPIEAASGLLASGGAQVSLLVDRAKGTESPEILITATGVVEPAADRGRMTYDYSGLVSIPGAPAQSPDPLGMIELRWDVDNLYSSMPLGDDGSAWSRMPRAEAPIRAGLVGRFPEEIRGLLALVADAVPASVEQLPGAFLGAVAAERFLVRVPLAEAVAEGVPADSPDVEIIRKTYGIDALPLEVWVVDDELRRIGYVLQREKALYGGPDRTSVTYDWANTGLPVDVGIPPPGTIEDR